MISEKKVPFQKITVITKEMLQVYSKASGDPNEIHLSDEVAQQHQLPGVIAHGMLLAGFLASRADTFINLEYENKFILKKSSFRFKSMSFPGDEISVGGTLKEHEKMTLTLDLEAINAQGEIKTVASFYYSCEV